MPPLTSRDFQRAAAQRLTSAETLLREKANLDAQYLGDYTVECSLKALILHTTLDAEKPDKLTRLSSGAKMHRLDVLLGHLRDLGIKLPLEITKRIRHSTGRPSCATRRAGVIQARRLPFCELRKRFTIGWRTSCDGRYVVE